MSQLTLTFPAGRSPMEMERLAAQLEQDHGCVVAEGSGVPLTLLERVNLVEALDHLVAVGSANSGAVRAIRDRLRESLR